MADNNLKWLIPKYNESLKEIYIKKYGEDMGDLKYQKNMNKGGL